MNDRTYPTQRDPSKKRKLTLGILAHVDAGKTTLSEALLFLSGKIRSLGRVDHKNTYLDTHAMERERGITVFSKQARFSTELCDIILLDTPGHVDFSPEAERTLALLDYAILVVSAFDGVQSHTRTLWQLLELYGIPTVIFVNKTDLSIRLAEDLERELREQLSQNCVGFYEEDTDAQRSERLALVHEDLLEQVLSGEAVEDGQIADLVSTRSLFPCFFGSALKLTGVEMLLNALDRYTLPPTYDPTFGARVFKISHAADERLTFIKLTGGSLSVRDELTYVTSDGTHMSEKITRIRLYSADRFEQVDRVSAGEICALCGPSATAVGMGLGTEEDSGTPILEPVLCYRLVLPREIDPLLLFPKLKTLEEEEPSLHLRWNSELQQIETRLMGEVQMDLLLRLISDRFGITCSLDEGRILYKEQIKTRSIGIGHYEPLRHYAEVQLLMEPQPKGTGLIFDVCLPENSLDRNWQRLILSHLYEKDHRGTAIGALLTDTKITLVAGRAHLKHTEGGDFREATLRAVRHGLMRAGCRVLEPYYRFRLELPTVSLGRAMSDLQARFAEFELERSDERGSILTGRAPVATVSGYAREVISYTHGEGRFFCVPDGYDPCHNEGEVLAEFCYDPETDAENPSHSIFCAGGAGFAVSWDRVEEYKHLDASSALSPTTVSMLPRRASVARQYSLSDDDLEKLMLREFGPIRRKKYSEPKRYSAAGEKKKPKPRENLAPKRQLLIVDGYNVIYAWESLRAIAEESLEKSRELLMDLLSNYVAYTKTELILVFDAYLVKDNQGSDILHDGYRVVYTKADQTADTYIEILMHELGPDYNVRVVTGDRLLQFSAVHSGILRMTAGEFEEEVTRIGNEITEFIKKLQRQNP